MGLDSRLRGTPSHSRDRGRHRFALRGAVLHRPRPIRRRHRRTMEGPRCRRLARVAPPRRTRRRGRGHVRSGRRCRGTRRTRDAPARLGHLAGDLRQHPGPPRLAGYEAALAAGNRGRYQNHGVRLDRARRRLQQPQRQDHGAAHRNRLDDLGFQVLHLGGRSVRRAARGEPRRRPLDTREKRAVVVRGSHRQRRSLVPADRHLDRLARTNNSQCSSTTWPSGRTR